MRDDYYHLLGVSRDATPVEVTAAFRRLARIHHPDKAFPTTDPNVFFLVQEAYGVLSDPVARRRYDDRQKWLECAPSHWAMPLQFSNCHEPAALILSCAAANYRQRPTTGGQPSAGGGHPLLQARQTWAAGLSRSRSAPGGRRSNSVGCGAKLPGLHIPAHRRAGRKQIAACQLHM